MQHTGVPNAGTYGSADQCANSCTHGCADCRTHRHANIGAYQRTNARADSRTDTADTESYAQSHARAYAASVYGWLTRLRQDGWWGVLRSRPEYVRVRLFGWL